MKKNCLALVFLIISTAASAQEKIIFKVDDATRTAIAYIPKTATTQQTPLVFAFHGHGGTAQNFFNKTHFEKLWPEAMIIYPQGLNTPGSLTDPEGKLPGWQNTQGKFDDRDLKFFDVMLSQLRTKYKINNRQIYATGHSNGGGFTYLLYAERGNVLAAVAPSAAVAGIGKINKFTPKAIMHIMGDNDPLVKSINQIRTIERLKDINKTTPEGQRTGKYTTSYKSTIGNFPVVTYIFKGGHNYPTGVETEIIKFFKENAKP